MSKDSLGNRMKDYEGRSQTYLPRRTYTYKNDGSMVQRSRWTIVEPPVFSQDPNWIWNWVHKL